MSVLRPLPARPRIEYDRKEARSLHRQLRAGDPVSVARARAAHPSLDLSSPAVVRLADAQHVIAREYGFASWPRLVHYHQDIARDVMRGRDVPTVKRCQASVRTLLAQHAASAPFAGRTLAAFIPRFYGQGIAEVLTQPVTEADAQLAVARNNGFPSWDELVDRAATEVRPEEEDEWEISPWQRASQAIQAADISALQAVVAESPTMSDTKFHSFGTKLDVLLYVALEAEQKLGRAALRPIVEWLLSRGHDLQQHLNVRLCGHMYMKPDEVRFLLERGADPHWVAPNGLSVLEHAVIRYWNGEALDVLAARVVPRDSLWIAAGLGDVAGVSRCLDRLGRPTRTARLDRAPIHAVGPISWAPLPDANDEEILYEAFFLAMLNGRTNVMEFLAQRGFNIDSQMLGAPMVNIAVGNAWVPAVECLVRLGANLDLRGWDSNGSARDMAREHFVHRPQNADLRRVATLCGHDVDALITARGSEAPATPTADSRLQRALTLAASDAAQIGQSAVSPENLLYGLLRGGGLALMFVTKVSGIDRSRFNAEVRPRVESIPEGDATAVSRPMRADAQALVDAATALAAERRSEQVRTDHLLAVLLRNDDGPAAQLLARYGSSVAPLRLAVERGL